MGGLYLLKEDVYEEFALGEESVDGELTLAQASIYGAFVHHLRA